jgi:hypothetical protein
LTAHADSSVATVEKAQQLPHCCWFWMGETTGLAWADQSQVAGGGAVIWTLDVSTSTPFARHVTASAAKGRICMVRMS